MNAEFKNNDKILIFSDDAIEVKLLMNNKWVAWGTYPYRNIQDIRFTLLSSTVIFAMKEYYANGQQKSFEFKYTKEQKSKLKEAVDFALEHVNIAAKEENELAMLRGTTYRYDTKYFKYDYKKKEIVAGAKHIPVVDITSGEEMSFWQDLAYNKVKITFKVKKDTYIIEGKTFDGVNDFPLEQYYDSIINDSKMLLSQKRIAKENKAYSNAELFASVATKATSQPISKKDNNASVIGRAVIGAAVAGSTGAIVGALSAIDENNKNKK